jgi:chemotaxis protein MotB
MKNILFIITTLAIITTSGCVSTSKYQNQVDENRQLENELRALKFVDEQNKKLNAEVLAFEDKLEQTEEVLFELNNKYNGLKQQHESLQKNYDDMLLRNQDLLEKAFADKTSLTEELIAKQAELNEKEKRLNKLEKDLSNERLKLDLSQKNLASRQQRIDSLSYLLEQNSSQLNAIQKKISDILIGYTNEEIAVERRADGRLYISLSQNLLFRKGSDQLDQKGIDALQKLAKALNSDPSIQIMVEGHTDSDGGQQLNWKLSTERALAVVDVLIASKVLPQRIIAAGRGQFQPVQPNTNEENKSRNRRTEIILSPNFEALQELLQSD